jgi:hypothetical protein
MPRRYDGPSYEEASGRGTPALLMNLFAIAAEDELWVAGQRLERRVEHGLARDDGDRIDAVDAADRELVTLAERAMKPLRAIAQTLADARVRIVARAMRENARVTTEAMLTVTMRGISVASSETDVLGDAEHLRRLVSMAPETDDLQPLPMVWLGGSAAVLFHEAAGHAAEHAMPRVMWPHWLRVEDRSVEGVADLLAGEAPRALRRESFRDVPLPRMTRVVVSSMDAPFSLPPSRVEIHLLAGGAFDPLTDIVTVHVAVADLVDGSRVQRLAPFTLRASRASVAAAVQGVSGEPMRYPGVICSSEGQELIVASYAPMMVTAALEPD